MTSNIKNTSFYFALLSFLIHSSIAFADVGVLISPANIRSGNNIKTASFEVKPAGSNFRVLEIKEDASGPSLGRWLKVQFQDGTIGWVNSKDAKSFNAQRVENERKSEEETFLADVDKLLTSIQSLQIKYHKLGFFSFGDREKILNLIKIQRQALDVKLGKASDFLSIEGVKNLKSSFQAFQEKAKKDLDYAGKLRFNLKKILRENLDGLNQHLTILNSSIQNFKTQAFIDLVKSKENPSITGFKQDSFKSPTNVALPETEREFKEKYQAYLNLANKGDSTKEEVEKLRSEYLKAYNVYKHIVGNSESIQALQSAPGKDIQLIIDKNQSLIHVVGADGNLIRSYPMSFGKEQENQSESGSDTFRLTSNMKNPWYSPDPPSLLPNIEKSASTRWMGINSPSLAITASPYIDELRNRGATGCVRMYTEDAEELSNLIAIGTPVLVRKGN